MFSRTALTALFSEMSDSGTWLKHNTRWLTGNMPRPLPYAFQFHRSRIAVPRWVVSRTSQLQNWRTRVSLIVFGRSRSESASHVRTLPVGRLSSAGVTVQSVTRQDIISGRWTVCPRDRMSVSLKQCSVLIHPSYRRRYIITSLNNTYLVTYLHTYLLHGAESFLRS